MLTTFQLITLDYWEDVYNKVVNQFSVQIIILLFLDIFKNFVKFLKLLKFEIFKFSNILFFSFPKKYYFVEN